MTSTDTRKKSAAVYREAAMHLERGSYFNTERLRFACHALHVADLYESEAYCNRMRKVFAPERQCDDAWLCAGEMSYRGRKNVRILALCLMAAMVEAGDA